MEVRWLADCCRCWNEKPGLEDRAFCVSGAENRNRTYDLRVTSALLYQLSYFGKYKVRLANGAIMNNLPASCRTELSCHGATAGPYQSSGSIGHRRQSNRLASESKV